MSGISGIQLIRRLPLCMILGHALTLAFLCAWNGVLYDFNLLSWATHLAALPFDVLTVAGFYVWIFGRL